MTEQELLALPVTTDLATAGRALGMGRTKAHTLARDGEFPVAVLTVNGRRRVRRADLLRELGYQLEHAPASPFPNEPR